MRNVLYWVLMSLPGLVGVELRCFGPKAARRELAQVVRLSDQTPLAERYEYGFQGRTAAPNCAKGQRLYWIASQ